MSNDQQPVNIPIVITADQASVSAAQNRIAELEKEINNLSKETAGFTDVTSLQAKQLKNATTELNNYRKATRELGKSNKEAANDVEALDQSLRKAASTLTNIKEKRLNEALNMQQSRFQQAGDVESGLRAFGGAAGAVGASGVAQGVGLAAELPGLIEGFGKLKNVFSSIPSIISGVATAIGPLGAVALGAGAAIALVANDIQKLKKQAEDFAKAKLAEAQSEADIRLLLIQGKREDALRILAQQEDEYNSKILEQSAIRQDIAEQEKILADDLARRRAGEDGLSVREQQAVQGRINELTDTLITLGTQADDAKGKIQNTAEILGITDTSMGGLAAATYEVRDASQEAKQAEEELAATRSAAALAGANELARQMQAEQRALAASTEQNKQRLQTIQDERNIIDAQIDYLNQQGVATEEVTKEIERLTQQFNALGQESEFIRNQALAQSKAQDSKERMQEIADEKRQTRIDKEIELREAEAEAQDEALAILEKHNEAVVNAAKKRVEDEQKALERLEDAREKAAQSLARNEEDAAIKRQRDELDNEIAFQRDRVKAAQELQRDLLDIQTNAAREEKQLAQDRNFAAIFELRNRTKEELEDRSKSFSEQERDASTAYQEQRQDMLTALDRERQDRQRNYERALADAQAQYSKELQTARDNETKALAELQNAKAQELAALQSAYAAEYGIALQFGQSMVALEAQIAQQRLTAAGGYSLSGVKNAVKGNQSGVKSGSSGSKNTEQPYSSGSTNNNSSSTTTNNNTLNPTINVSGSGNPQIAARNVAKELQRLMK